MHRVLVLGAGKIGRAIAMFLQSAGDFDVLVADADKAALTKLQGMVPVETTLADAGDPVQLRALMRDRDSVISALVFSAHPAVAAAAVETSTSYFDLTEDVATTRAVRQYAERGPETCILMPQCGLARARREMGVELKTAVVWDRFFGEDIRVRGDLRRADGDLCVAGTGFG